MAHHTHTQFAVYIDFSCTDRDTQQAWKQSINMASLRHKLEREREREGMECALDRVSLAVHNVLRKELIRPSIVPAPWCSHRVTRAIQQCDFFLIPVVDPDYSKWSRPMMVAAKHGQDSSINRFKNGQLEAFESAGWHDYLERAWCRLELMEAAAYPVNNCEERTQTALSKGLRPCAIYTDWFMAQDGQSAEFLPPLKHDFFERYQPGDVKLFDEEDRYRVREITRRTRDQWTGRGGGGGGGGGGGSV